MLKKLLAKYNTKVCVLLYLLGVIWLPILHLPQFKRSCYISENSLIPGKAITYFNDIPNQDILDIQQYVYNTEHENEHSVVDKIFALLQKNEIESYQQKFSSEINEIGTNTYAIIRARRTINEECIVLNVPIKNGEENYAVGQVISYGKIFQNQLFWAKDLILLFSEQGNTGVEAFIGSYNLLTTRSINSETLHGRAGSIQAGIVLEFKLPKINIFDVKLEGFNGKLPNLDLFNLAKRMANKHGYGVSINNLNLEDSRSSNWLINMQSSLNMMIKQFTGHSNKNHALLLRHIVESLTLETKLNDSYKKFDGRVEGMIVVEHILRSLNNLEERLHQSFFYYMLPSTTSFVSNGSYVYSVLLMLFAPLLQVFGWHLAEENKLKKHQKYLTICDEVINNKGLSEVYELPTLQLYHSAKFITIWYKVSVIALLCQLVAFFLYKSINYLDGYRNFFWLTEILCVFIGLKVLDFSSFVGNNTEIRHRSEELSIFRLLITLGTISIYNFSFAFICSLFLVPVILFISASNRTNCKLVQWISMILLISVSPFILTKVTKHFNLIGSFHNWSLFTYLLYFPAWLNILICTL